jgi:hypothetical protein
MFTFLISNAQSTPTAASIDSTKTGLTEKELQLAKDLYVKMMKTETYVLFKKDLRTRSKKLKNLKLPPYGEMNQCDREQVKKWLAANLSKTDFKSVDEGLDTLLKGCMLLEKLHVDNAELYSLISKAKVAQIGEIMMPEREAMQAELYD